MDAMTDEDFAIAEARGKAVFETGPRARAVRFDAMTRRIVIDLVNGCAFSMPTDLVQDLRGADNGKLIDVVVDGLGLNLRWPTLDVDLFVPALLGGTFGTKVWMAREMARVAGRISTPKKATAARSNGAKGGRPRRNATA